MNWIQNLYETYENCQSMIGAGSDDNEVPLLPICHTTQKAQIEITLDEKGDFRRARVIPKDESRTIIPCTEKSAGRTNNEEAHPLCDKLQYLAADYKKYGGEEKHYFNSFIALLESWVNAGSPKKVQVIYHYIKRGTVIHDLVANQILFAGEDGRLLLQRPSVKDKKAGLDIFDLHGGGIDPKSGKYKTWQADAFVRWKAEIPGEVESAVWNDTEVIQSWVDYYSSTKETKVLCYVTGEESFSADQHPAKIRNDGDKAKIISSNDKSGFTFRGRFTKAEQAATVGFETTQKAHYTLRWLMNRQGKVFYVKEGNNPAKPSLSIVAWAISGAVIPQPTTDTYDLWDNLPSEQSAYADTAQEIGVQLRQRIAGYGKKLSKTEKVVVMALDSATTGRLAITYYRDLTSSDFLERIDNWHETCAWLHRYKQVEVRDEQGGKVRKKYVSFVGAPSPSDIAEAAYGSRLDDKLRKATIARLLPCIVDGQPIPRDLVESVVRRASNRVGIKDPEDKKYRGDDEYTWEKTLSIACALFKKFKDGKEKYDMALDPNRKTRDYLYGRLLALADSLEEWALNEAKENRSTNAARLMQRFAERPYSTWRTIELALTPYKARLGGKSKKRQRMIDEVIALFDAKDFAYDKPLSGEFLLGYHCQREFLRPGNVENPDGDGETADTTNNANSKGE